MYRCCAVQDEMRLLLGGAVAFQQRAAAKAAAGRD
jgi:hypothetical protein